MNLIENNISKIFLGTFVLYKLFQALLNVS